MTQSRRQLLFRLFFVSGFSGLVYQVVWTRMAFAAFGILTPVLSVVISVFMLGLSVGSWAGGRCIGPLTRKTGWPAMRFYALAEFAIGIGAYAVPRLFGVGKRWLLATGQSDSFVYLALSGLVLALSILPWCLFMGTTFPWMMAGVREREPEAQTAQIFSYLYLANVLGATSGTLLSAFVMIELLGFHDTLQVAALGNLFVAAIGLRLSLSEAGGTSPAPLAAETRVRSSEAPVVPSDPTAAAGSTVLEPGLPAKCILFTTGFISMALEVAWTRAFAPVIKSQVYSFALVVAAYLASTFCGSLLYRRDLARKRTFSSAQLIALLAIAVFLPVLINQRHFIGAAWLIQQPDPLYVGLMLGSICPFCGVLGYLTPSLVDKYSGGSPVRAGSAYAVNVLGCILGPLFACYALLPRLSERATLILLGLPLVLLFVLLGKTLPAKQRLGYALPIAAILIGALRFTLTYEDYVTRLMPPMEVRRDHAATVISCGKRFDRALLVNGYGMTTLSPAAKFMVHLPLALHAGRSQSALIICFGMGTSFRSALSWGVRTTAVELSPAVRDAFAFYHADAAEVLRNPNGHIVVDDGRRYLERSPDTYDVIVIDPPPPVETAGSSLLYSGEFYDAAKRRLNAGGILQEWIPERNTPVAEAALRTLCKSFPYVRCFAPYGGDGMHMLASMQPIETCSLPELLTRMPKGAWADLVEWLSAEQLAEYLQRAFATQITGQRALDPRFQIQITDDRPYNEYYFLRKLVWP